MKWLDSQAKRADKVYVAIIIVHVPSIGHKRHANRVRRDGNTNILLRSFSHTIMQQLAVSYLGHLLFSTTLKCQAMH